MKPLKGSKSKLFNNRFIFSKRGRWEKEWAESIFSFSLPLRHENDYMVLHGLGAEGEGHRPSLQSWGGATWL